MYSHDALGLGHIRRSLAIARAVLEARNDLAALLLTCSPMVDALPSAPGLDYIKLPSAKKVANREYVARTLPIGTDVFMNLRSALVRETARHFDPDLFLVDKSPSGLMGELRPTFQLLRERKTRPRTVLGLRDILDEPEATREEWQAAGWVRFIERTYDELWIYGDPDLFDAPHAYAWPDWLVERVRYLGYLVNPVSDSERREARRQMGGDRRPLALVTVGGGEDGEHVIATYLEAARRRLLPSDLKSVVVLGPCMPSAAQSALREHPPPGVDVECFVPDLAPSIAAADVVVGMAGYNTVCELLAGRTPAILAPRVKPRREQWLRARALAERGIAEYLEPDHLAPGALADAVRRALRRGRPQEGLPATDGLEQVARRVDEILPGPAFRHFAAARSPEHVAYL